MGWGWEALLFKNWSLYRSVLFKSSSCAKTVIIRKSSEEEVSIFYDVLLEALRFLSQWEMNGRVEKEGVIIIWLSSQEQAVRAGK